jgi:hypothetical protein
MKSNDWLIARAAAFIGVRVLFFQSFNAVAAYTFASHSADMFYFGIGCPPF